MVQKRNNLRVLVTGASKGIGYTIAKTLSENGYSVIGTCRNPEFLSNRIFGVVYVELDLSSDRSIECCAESVGCVDILINNAGQSQMGSAEDTSPSDYRELMQINFFGLAYLTSLIIPSMRKAGFGKILNIGSLIASFPVAYYTNYASTKAATKAYSFALSMELEPFNIQVAVLEPHDVKTTIKPKLIGGSGVYKKYISTLNENVRYSMEKARSPQLVADKVLKIISKKKMAPIYIMGMKSKLLALGKRFTSQGFVNKNVYKSFGLKNIG